MHRLEHVQEAFAMFSKIGGAFVLAVVLDVSTWLYCLACSVLFNQCSLPLAFKLSLVVFGALLDILVLLAITELGQRMKDWT